MISICHDFGSVNIEFVTPTVGDVVNFVASPVLSTLMTSTGSAATLTMVESVRGIVNGHLCGSNVPITGAGVTTTTNGYFGPRAVLASSVYTLTAPEGVVGQHDSEECRYRLNDYDACEYVFFFSFLFSFLFNFFVLVFRLLHCTISHYSHTSSYFSLTLHLLQSLHSLHSTLTPACLSTKILKKNFK